MSVKCPPFKLMPKKYHRRDYYYGTPKDCPVGTLFHDRQTLSQAMVHGFTQAGIHGNINTGTYSVVISGGYEDDEDYGEWFWYTGEGGRSAAGKQIKDQSWKDKGNRSLLMSTMYPRRPVRVVRGHIPKSPYGPAEGLRYDGLYRIMRVCTGKGKSGHKICKALFKRVEDQAPLPPPRWAVSPQGEKVDATLSSSHEIIEISDSEEDAGSRSSREIIEISDSEEDAGVGETEAEVSDPEIEIVFVTKPSNAANILVRKRQRSEDDLGARATQRTTVDPTCTLPQKDH